MSDPQRPHGLQPTRFPRPWDSPGRSTGWGAQWGAEWGAEWGATAFSWVIVYVVGKELDVT